MIFNDAVKQLIKLYDIEILNDRFRTRSILSDLVGSDIYSKKLVNALFITYSKVNIAKTFEDNGLTKGRLLIAKVYNDIKDEVRKNEFIDAVNLISEIILPDEFMEAQKNKKVIKVNKIVVKKATPVNNKPITPTTPNTPNNTNKVTPHIINTPPPAKPKQLKLGQIYKNQFNKIKIKASKTNLKIRTDDGSYIVCKVFRNGVVNVDVKDVKLTNGTLVINLNRYHPRELTIIIPNQFYELIEVEGKELHVDLDGVTKKNVYNVIDVKDIKIRTTNSNVNVSRCLGQSIKVNNNLGFICIKGNYAYVETENELGYTKLNLITNKRNYVKVDAMAISGDINLEFEEGRVKPRVSTIFRREYTIDKECTVKNCKIDLHLHSNRGRVKVK